MQILKRSWHVTRVPTPSKRQVGQREGPQTSLGCPIPIYDELLLDTTHASVVHILNSRWSSTKLRTHCCSKLRMKKVQFNDSNECILGFLVKGFCTVAIDEVLGHKLQPSAAYWQSVLKLAPTRSMRAVKHQKASASSCMTYRSGDSRSDMPCTPKCSAQILHACGSAAH